MTPTLKVGELLEMHARYHRHPRPIDEVMALVELDARRDDLIEKLSGGQRRRLDLALALVGDPDLLFLDEPTTGFDPGARRHAWAAIRSLCSLGKTVVLTTHYMDEAQALADRVGVMVGGRARGLRAAGAARAGATSSRPRSASRCPPLPLPDLRRRGGRDRGRRRCWSPPQYGLETAHRLTGWALEHGVALRGFAVAQPTSKTSTWRSRHDRPGALAGPLRAARVLAQPALDAVHLRVPGDAAARVRLPQHRRDARHPRRHLVRHLLRARHPRLRAGRHGVLEPRAELLGAREQRDDQARPGHAAAVGVLRGRPGRLDASSPSR